MPRAPSPLQQSSQYRSSSQPPPANKSVQFNLDPASPVPPSSPAQIRKRRQRAGSTNAQSPYLHPNANQPSDTNVSDSTLVNSDRPPRHRRHHRAHSQDERKQSPNPAESESDATIDLPDRFDQYGRKKPEKGDDPLADNIEEFLSGKGKGGKWLSKLLGEESGEEGARADEDAGVGGREYRDREREKRRRRRSGR